MMIRPLSVFVLTLGLLSLACGQAPGGGTSVIPANAHLTTGVGGLSNTNATATVINATGPGFTQALQVTVRTQASQTNATQLTIQNSVSVQKDDVLLATFYLRGSSTSGGLGTVEFLFEQSTNPWTKSVTQGASTKHDPTAWRAINVAFKSAGNYSPGQVMASLRFAFSPQTVEIGGLTVLNYQKTKTLDELIDYTVNNNPLGDQTVSVNFSDLKQTMVGLGGNFCQPRYGFTQELDAVGKYVLANLNVTHARVGLPLEKWNPAPGSYQDNNQARASLLALQILNKRKIPLVVSIWEGPLWMLGGQAEQQGRVLPTVQYTACIEAIAQYLKTAKDTYGVDVPYVSFNEPDYGVNFLFTSTTMRNFIRQAGPRFAQLGLSTKFIVADTANGSSFYDYALPMLQDTTIEPYLGPLGFHSWDAMSATDLSYQRIAQLGNTYNKPVWCLEAGHDAQLWQAQNPWNTWDNALKTAIAYERTIRLTGASVMDYWTYQDNYPMVSSDGMTAYPVFQVMRQMQDVFVPNSRIALTSAVDQELQCIATRGKGSEFAVLLINAIGNGSVTLNGLPAKATVSVFVSDKGAQRKRSNEVFQTSESGILSLKMPARSVLTVSSTGPKD